MKNTYPWARFPSQWVLDGKLANFEVGHTSLEALRLYLGMASWISIEDWKAESPEFHMSYNDMQRICGLNRSAILSGLNKLESQQLIAVTRQTGCPSRYQLMSQNFKFAKVPLTIVDGEKLKGFSLKGSLIPQYSRTEAVLDSLKLYLLLLALRNSHTNRALIGYDGIVTRTGVPRKNIRRAISMLINLGLIHVESTIMPGMSRQGANRYFISDLARYRPMNEEAS